MANVRAIEAIATSTGPPEAVWRLLADVDTWSAWGLFDESRLRSPGSPDPQGVGAIREFRAGRIRNVEEVVRFDAPSAFAYEVREGGVPVRDYHADVTLTPTGEGGTRIEWRSTFRSKLPGLGGLIERRLGAFVRETCERLARAAEAG